MRFLLLPVLILLLSGCATGGAHAPHAGPDPRDPLEPVNRAMFEFNSVTSRTVLDPASRIYRGVVPGFLRDRVGAFFGNLDDTVVLVSSILQGRYIQSLETFSRLGWNTTVGLGGLFDVASHLDLPKRSDDLGIALASWGVGQGPYLVLPFLGPSSARDAAGIVGSWWVNPMYHHERVDVRNSLVAFRFFNAYASLYGTGRLVEEAAIDPYVFAREAWLQNQAARTGAGPVFLDDDPGAD